MRDLEWVNNKLEQIRNEQLHPKYNYRKYLIAIYNLYYKDAVSNPEGYSFHITMQDMINAIGDVGGYDFDDDPVRKAREYKKTLTDLGYIHSELKQGNWRVYIDKELDF